MPKRHLLVVPLAVSLIAACAPIHRPVDLSSSKSIVTATTLERLKTVADVAVMNKAPDAQNDHHFLGADQVAINPEVRTSAIVANDVKDYFSSRLLNDHDGKRAIRVTVERADAYWTLRGAIKVPIVGLFALAGNDEFHMHTVIRIETEEVNRPTRTYIYDQATELPDGNAAFPSDIDKSYQRLIAESRKQLAQRLDKEFLPEYLAQ